jgi:hypothetical protein
MIYVGDVIWYSKESEIFLLQEFALVWGFFLLYYVVVIEVFYLYVIHISS